MSRPTFCWMRQMLKTNNMLPLQIRSLQLPAGKEINTHRLL